MMRSQREATRTIRFASTSVRSSEISGQGSALESTIERLEAGSGSYYLEETSSAPQPDLPLSARRLQYKRIARDHFELTRYNLAVLRVLGGIGVHTYADLLALGTQQLAAHSARVTEKYVYTPGGKFGGKAFGLLRLTTFVQTGHHLPEHPATPAELLTLYDDIAVATPALALPTDKIGCYADLDFTGPYKQQTVGSLVDSEVTQDYWATRSALAGQDFATFANFVSTVLPEQVIAPFEAARIQAA